MKQVRALVLTGYGLNCDHETAYALELAGARAVRIHINDLISGAENLKDYRIMAFGGGFSWGDDHGAGVIQAVRMKTHIGKQLLDFIGRGNLVIGICNGFQTLVNLGLLPGLYGDYTARSVALTVNQCGNFRNDWVHLTIDPKSSCIFTRGMTGIELPVRHGEGKFVTDPATLQRLSENRQIVMRYALADGNPADGRFPANPNGSLQDVAAICDPTGRVFGLMPHPEAYNHWTSHPGWTRKKARFKVQGTNPETEVLAPGIRLLKNAVEHAAGL